MQIGKSPRIPIKAQELKQHSTSIASTDNHPEARMTGDPTGLKFQIAMRWLRDEDNRRNRQITKLIEKGNDSDARIQAGKKSKLGVLNDILNVSLRGMELSINDATDEVVATRSGVAAYPFSSFSDGERNAALLAAIVLSAPKGSLLLIDEPERHLHRSISIPLLNDLVADRADCSFIVSTHDTDLVAASSDSQILCLRGVQFENSKPKSWMINAIEPKANIPESIRKDILGAREKVIFVEGKAQGLDQSLYEVLYPDYSILPRGNSSSVRTAVKAANESSDTNWLHAYGIVDGDGQAKTRASGKLTVLPCYSVESLYYGEQVVQAMAHKMSTVLGKEIEEVTQEIEESILSKSKEHRDKLCKRIAERRVLMECEGQIPRSELMFEEAACSISIDPASILKQEFERFDELVSKNSAFELVGRYPVRETGLLDIIAKRLGLNNRKTYEQAVRARLLEDGELRKALINLIGLNLERPS